MVVEKIIHANGKIIEWKWSSNDPRMERPFWTSAYLLDQILIDCGAPASEREMGEFIESLSLEYRPKKCYLTHAHEDHAGTGNFLTEKMDIPVYSPPESIPTLEKGWNYKEYRKMSWGKTGFRGFKANPYEIPFTTQSGYEFEIINLPGHADDLNAFIERSEGWAFLGDLMQPNYQMLFGHTCEIQEDIRTIADSLEKLYAVTDGIPNLTMFVAGKGVFTGRELIRTRIDEIHSFCQKVHEIHDSLDEDMKPKKKMRKILKVLFGRESILGGLTEGELSRENMIKSCLKWPINDS